MFALNCIFAYFSVCFSDVYTEIYVNSLIPLDKGNGVIKFSHFACRLVS